MALRTRSVWSLTLEVGSGELDGPAARGEPGQRIEQGRLAGTVGADETDDGSLSYVEVDTVDRDHPAVAHPEIVRLEHDVSAGHRARGPSGCRQEAAVRGHARRSVAVTLLQLCVNRPDDALGIEDQGDDESEPCDDGKPLTTESEQVTQDERDHATHAEQARRQCPPEMLVIPAR